MKRSPVLTALEFKQTLPVIFKEESTFLICAPIDFDISSNVMRIIY